ncbi:MAG: Diacetyl reductase ((S)-acetoin forming) [Chloroflexi bacterium ADurb.Bin325]|nr:MAG: Diacetyl reductase ((S)-acetoin forming) [Chloroflexi bacterium ADurb.Bin325]
MTRFADKVAIVTGAGQGIGKGIALRLAREGAQVVIAEYNAAAAEAAAAEVGAAPYPVDISDVAAVHRMVDEIAARFGHIDILVNNAGVAQTKPMLELTEADWDRVLDVNLRGTFFLIQAVAQQMIRQLPAALRAAASAPADIVRVKPAADAGPERESFAASYGKIVSLSSVAGRRGRPLQTHYAASKAAIISLTQSTALALAPYRINANAVCPGIVPTPMWEKIDEERGRLFGSQPGEAMAAFINTVPLKRAATAEDVAAAVAFFCSSDADYITGQALNVDGGFEMD